jgi:cell division protein FtsI (penicillin-binding protein 3)
LEEIRIVFIWALQLSSFDPNEYTKTKDLANFNNINTTGNYESGSVFKAFTMAAAIDSGKVTPDTTYVDEQKIEKS